MQYSNGSSSIFVIPNQTKPELLCESGNIFGTPYHIVKPCFLSQEVMDEMKQWCQTAFGEEGRLGSGPRWVVFSNKYWFSNVQDRDWFLLRWCAK